MLLLPADKCTPSSCCCQYVILPPYRLGHTIANQARNLLDPLVAVGQARLVSSVAF